jgi:hypothetical protein
VSKDGALRDRRASAMSNPSNIKRTYSIRDTQAERRSRLYVYVRAGCGCAAIQPLLSQRERSVDLLRPSVSRQSRHRPRATRVSGKYATSKPNCVLGNRGGVGCQRQCDRFPDPECRDCPSERKPKAASLVGSGQLDSDGRRLAYSLCHRNDRGGQALENPPVTELNSRSMGFGASWKSISSAI